MRMLHYFSALAVASSVALIGTAALGVLGAPVAWHLTLGLVGAILGVATHTLLILFMIVTGRVLKAATRTRELDRAFLGELNQFFARKAAYPLAVFAAFAIVTTAVLGYGQRAFGLSPAVHMLVGLSSLVFHLWALQHEWRALGDNQALLDRTASELDRMDAEGAPVAEEVDPSWASPPLRWLLFAIAWWAPYLYWGLVVWRGDFSHLGLHPWIELSLFGLAMSAVTFLRREPGSSTGAPPA